MGRGGDDFGWVFSLLTILAAHSCAFSRFSGPCVKQPSQTTDTYSRMCQINVVYNLKKKIFNQLQCRWYPAQARELTNYTLMTQC